MAITGLIRLDAMRRGWRASDSCSGLSPGRLSRVDVKDLFTFVRSVLDRLYGVVEPQAGYFTTARPGAWEWHDRSCTLGRDHDGGMTELGLSSLG